jgi:putative ABC transport system permease protein
LLNAVLARIVAQERTQIATLRALGFRIAPIVRHYLSLAALIAALGSLLGVLLGVPMGVGLTRTYGDFFHFPDLHYELEPLVVVAALCTSVSAALLGALAPVLKVLRMPPAEAMQPPSPHAFEASWLERSGVSRHLPTNLRLVVRNVARRPWRTVSAVSGVAAAMAVLVVGAFWSDALDALLEHQFRRVQHDDATVGLVSPTRDRAVRELARVPGVRLVEGIRALPVRLSSGGRSKRAELLGLTSSTTLRRLVTRDGHEVALPADGLVLSRHLARRLRAGPGTALTLDVLEGKRARREVRVAFVVDELLGESAYMRSDALFRLLAEAPTVSAAYLAIEPGREAEVHAALRRFPGVAAVNVTRAFVRRFEDTLMEIVVLFSLVLTLFGALVVVGVVYNTARILVAEREREFATLRVLGFGRADISESLFLELGVQVLPALGLGALMGYGLSAVAVRLFGPEDMSIPLVIGSRTWGLALAVVVVSAVGSALVVRRRLDRLDLLAVLKVRE